MPETESGLEKKVQILEGFVYDTPHTDHLPEVAWFSTLLGNALLGFRYSFQYSKEPEVVVLKGEESPYRLEQLKEDLKPFVAEEERLMDEYDKRVFRGKYENSDGWDYMEEMGKKLGKSNEEILEEAMKGLFHGSKEWEDASSMVAERRRKFIEERRKTIDYEAALGTLIEIMRIRKRAYEKMSGFEGLLVDAWGLSQDEQKEGIGKLMLYIRGFSFRVTELIKRFSYPEKFTEFGELLPPYAGQ